MGEDKEIGQDRQPKELFEVEVSCWGGDTMPIKQMFQRALEADLHNLPEAAFALSF